MCTLFTLGNQVLHLSGTLEYHVIHRGNRELEGDINAQLREACQEGEEYEVKRLLKEGADSYACDEVEPVK